MNRCRALPRAAVVLAAMAALSLSACTSSSDSKDFSFSTFTPDGGLMAVAQRKPAQDIGGDLLAGGKTSLAASKGKVVVVNFFASWCEPCQTETPQFGLLAKKVASKGVTFLGIDTKDNTAPAKTFVQQSGVTYPIVYDQEGKVALQLGNIPASLPFTVLIDRTGKVAAVYRGRQSDKDMQGPIDKLAAER